MCLGQLDMQDLMDGAWWWRDHDDHSLMYLGPCMDGYMANLNHITCFTVLEWEMRNKSMYLLERRVLSDFSASWTVSFCLNIPLCSPFFKRAPLFIFNMFTYLFYIFWPHCTVCGILVPQPGIKPTPPALEAWSLIHWTTRKAPVPHCWSMNAIQTRLSRVLGALHMQLWGRPPFEQNGN